MLNIYAVANHYIDLKIRLMVFSFV